jgi:hypothetical protein
MKNLYKSLFAVLILVSGSIASAQSVSTTKHAHGMSDTDVVVNQCVIVPSSDQITGAAAFASTCALPPNLPAGTTIEVEAAGFYTTSAAGAWAVEVNAGGDTGICPSAPTLVLPSGGSAAYWDLTCKIVIVSTGSSGTAAAWGWYQRAAPNGSAPVQAVFSNAGSLPAYNTSVGESVSIQATTFTGTSMNLQAMFVRVTLP